MLGFLKADPKKKVKKQIAKLYEQAVAYQRNGKLKEYAEVISKIEQLEKQDKP